MLTYLGHNWGGASRHRGRPRYSDRVAAHITRSVTSRGKVVTWDTPYVPTTGLIRPRAYQQLLAIGKAAGTTS